MAAEGVVAASPSICTEALEASPKLLSHLVHYSQLHLQTVSLPSSKSFYGKYAEIPLILYSAWSEYEWPAIFFFFFFYVFLSLLSDQEKKKKVEKLPLHLPQ